MSRFKAQSKAYADLEDLYEIFECLGIGFKETGRGYS